MRRGGGAHGRCCSDDRKTGVELKFMGGCQEAHDMRTRTAAGTVGWEVTYSVAGQSVILSYSTSGLVWSKRSDPEHQNPKA